MGSFHDPDHDHSASLTEVNIPLSSLVAPLDTHGLLSEPGPGSEDPSTATDGFFRDARNHHMHRATRTGRHASMETRSDLDGTSSSTHGQSPVSEFLYGTVHSYQDTCVNDGSIIRRIPNTVSSTSTVSRNHTQHGSISQGEPLIVGRKGSDHDEGQTGHSNTTKGPLTTYPPTSGLKPTGNRKFKRLQEQPLQDTHFFFRGHLVTGGDNIWPLIGSITLLLGLGGLWLGTTGVWIWRDGLGGGGAGKGGKAAVIIFGYLLGVCFGAMAATAFRDPGILPRNLDVEYPIAETSSGEYEPATREVKVRNGTVNVKYCDTCKLYRPPRSSHCRLCGNCVEGIDHHCTYLHNCVGKRNYTSFVAFLVSSVLALIYTVVFSALHYSILCSREDITFRTALGRVPEAAVSFTLGILLLGPIMALLCYHLRLMVINATTVEQIRASAAKGFLSKGERPINHFTYGSFLKNFAYSVCRPLNPSWIDANGWEVKDERIPNPGARTGPVSCA